MSNLRDAFSGLLSGDTTFSTPLTGGIYDLSDLGPDGLTPSNPACAGAWTSGGSLRPCALLHWRTAQNFGPHFDAEQAYVELYVYQLSGVAIVEAALLRAKALLHRVQLTASDYGLCWVNALTTRTEIPAPELGGALGGMARFEIHRIRK